MSDINVTVTNAGAAQVSVPNGSTVNTTVGNGGAVNVAIGTISPGNASVVSGTVQVGKVVTLAAGSNATVENKGTSYAAVLDFGIPQGAAGATGPTGPAGKDGITPAFAIGTVSTLAAGSVATVTATTKNSGANVTLDFGIPRGDPGTGGGSSVSLSDGNPAALGATASPGTSSLASRADHVHAVPVISYASLTNVPSTFAPAAHQHAIADVTGLQTALDSKSGTSHGHNYVTALNNLTGPLTIAAGTGVTITPSGSTLTIASTASAPLADATPQPLGIAAVGTSTDAAREDHVHAMPSAADVGALDENSIVDGGFYEGYIPQNTITITSQPTPQTASNGAAQFSVAATSTPGGTLSYQWEKQDGGFGDYNAVSGATSATLSLAGLLNTEDDGDRYRVVVSATNAVSVTSQSALLTVPANAITITTQPSNQTASGGAATFTVAATVAPSGTPSYQWQRSDDAGVSWANVAGATSATLALTGLTVEADGGSQFRVIVSATNAVSVTSNAATLTVQSNNTITITSQPTNQTASGGAASFSVAATSSPAGTPTYQWQRSDFYYPAGYSSARWSVQSLPASSNWRALAYGGNTFVAITTTATTATSADGKSWTARSLPVGSGNFGADLQPTGITYANGLFVVVSHNSQSAFTSADGITWTARALPPVSGWRAVGYGNGMFVAISNTSFSGSGNIFATSPDGITWTQRDIGFYEVFRGIAYGNGTFLAYADSTGGGSAATSADGVTWIQRSQAGAFRDVAYGDNAFIGLRFSSSPPASRSVDGITWTSLNVPITREYNAIVHADGRFVAISAGAGISVSMASENGISFLSGNLPVGAQWQSLAYGQGAFVALEYGGNRAFVSEDWRSPYANIPGATSSTLALTGLTASNDQDQYRAVVSATNAAPVTSNAATLTVP